MEFRVYSSSNNLLLNLTKNELRSVVSVLYSADLIISTTPTTKSLPIEIEYTRLSAIRLSSLIAISSTKPENIEQAIQNTSSYENLYFERLEKLNDFEDYSEFLGSCSTIMFKIDSLGVQRQIETEPFFYMSQAYSRVLQNLQRTTDAESYKHYSALKSFYLDFVDKLIK